MCWLLAASEGHATIRFDIAILAEMRILMIFEIETTVSITVTEIKDHSRRIRNGYSIRILRSNLEAERVIVVQYLRLPVRSLSNETMQASAGNWNNVRNGTAPIRSEFKEHKALCVSHCYLLTSADESK